MADELVTDDELDNEDGSPNVQRMRERIKQLAKETKEAADIKRENALLRAGVDLSSPIGQLFSDGYKGELSPEAVKEAAEKVGALKVEPTEATTGEAEAKPEVTDEEKASTAERQALASGATPDAGITEDPLAAASKLAEQIRAEGGTEHKAMASQFAAIVAAGHDPRVQVQPIQRG